MHGDYLTAIRNFEGFTQKATWDYAQFSNGYGTKARFAGEVISETEARHRFDQEIASARAVVEQHAGHVDDGTKAALTSLTYNAGSAWTRSGLGEAIRNNDLEAARGLFVQYNKAGGETLPGLVHRRLTEVAWIGAGSSIDDSTTIPSRTTPAHAASPPLPHLAAERLITGAISRMAVVHPEAAASAMPPPTSLDAGPLVARDEYLTNNLIFAALEARMTSDLAASENEEEDDQRSHRDGVSHAPQTDGEPADPSVVIPPRQLATA